MRFTPIETERLILRPLEITDAEHIFSTWTSDPRVTKFMIYSTHKNVEETRQWLQTVADNADNEKVLDAGFQLKETGKLIGSGGAYYQSQYDRWSLGYNLAYDHWHKGYTTEAARAIVDFLSAQGIKRFMADHAIDNPNSGKVMEKIGMKFDHMGVYACFDDRVFDAKYYIMDLDRPNKEF